MKRKESRSGSNRDPSAYQPSALPLGHTGLRLTSRCNEGNMGLYVHRNHEGLLGTGSWGVRNFISNMYSLRCHHHNDSADTQADVPAGSSCSSKRVWQSHLLGTLHEKFGCTEPLPFLPSCTVQRPAFSIGSRANDSSVHLSSHSPAHPVS